MNTNNIFTMELNVTIENCNEVANIIDRFHILNIITFLNSNSLTIRKVTLDNYENVVNIIDRLYKINAIQFHDWSLISLQLAAIKVPM